MKKNVVIFCGGRGAEGLIQSMRGKYNLSLVVNAYDDGHSTGRLRELFSILGPSDCRKNCEYLLGDDISVDIKELFSIRFSECNTVSDVRKALQIESSKLSSKQLSGSSAEVLRWLLSSISEILERLNELSDDVSLEDCSLMNLILVNEVIKEDSFQAGVDAFLSAFNVNDRIILNSEENLALMALTRSGHILFSEGDVVEGRSSEIIDEIYLIPYSNYADVKKEILSTNNFYDQVAVLRQNNCIPKLSSRVEDVISNSDIIVYAAGTANSSLYPTYLTKGLAQAITQSSAQKLMLVNIGADYETPDYKASDFVKNTIHFLGNNTVSGSDYMNSHRMIDTVFVNQPIGIDRHHIVFDNMDPIFSLVNVVPGNYEDPHYKGRHTDTFFELINRFILE